MSAIKLSILLVFVGVSTAWSQTTQIGGKITDGIRALSNVGVLNKSSNVRSKSTKAGDYIIKAKVNDTLLFSLLGYDSYELVVSHKVVENVQLRASNTVLEEVAVVAYTPRTKDVLTGSAMAVRQMVVGSSGTIVRGISSPVHTESYAEINENKFLNPQKDPLSTFAADVDRASYSNVKRFLESGVLPPKDAVRIEEMINYFPYEVAQPKGDNPVNILTELTQSPWNKENYLLRVSLKAKDIPKENLPASNFVFLIDVSGSMQDQNKLPLVKTSFKMLVDQLRDIDQVAIVTYAGNANIALGSTSGADKVKIKDAIDKLEADGSTAGGDGLKMAYDIARQNLKKGGNNRVVMATDGDFNVGASSDDDMESLIVKERESHINISVLGYGMGNYKDSKLEILANKGRGNYAYINDLSEARKAIITEFGGTMFTVAKDVKIQVEFNPKFVQAYRLVGYENRLMAAEDFNNDKKVGGDMGVGHLVTALYEIVPVGVKSTIVGSVDPLKYQENKKTVVNSPSSDLATVKFRYKDPQADKSKLQEQVVLHQVSDFGKVSSDFQFITAVVELGMLLRDSEYKQGSDMNNLIQRAKANKGADDHGDRAEFIRLAETAKILVK